MHKRNTPKKKGSEATSPTTKEGECILRPKPNGQTTAALDGDRYKRRRSNSSARGVREVN